MLNLIYKDFNVNDQSKVSYVLDTSIPYSDKIMLDIPKIKLKEYVKKALDDFSNLDNSLVYYKEFDINDKIVIFGHSGMSYGSYFNRINEWYENINIVNGIEEESQGYLTSNLAELGPNMISNKYIVGGVWLGYAGIKGTRWDLWFHFYDESDNFIETIHTYQYTRCRIPLNAKSVRCSLTCKKEELSNFGFDHMKETRYFKIKDCHWEDNRTCCAPFQAQFLVFDNCDFIRSGQSITPCCIDLEDGWERMQDIFIVNCGPLNVIDNSGINHQMINCSNVSYTARYRLVGFTIRDCKDVASSLTSS